jgi:ATP-binding cassette subfamily F protein uup
VDHRASDPAARAAAGPTSGTATAPRKTRLSYNEKRELERLPQCIAALEAEQAAVETRLADPATYQPGAADVAALSARREAIETELLALLEHWERLEQVGR